MDEDVKIEETETAEDAPVAEPEVVKEKNATRAAVVGEAKPEEIQAGDFIEVMICKECGYIHAPGKGVAWCAACGGKTALGLAKNKDKIVAEDEKRFQVPDNG